MKKTLLFLVLVFTLCFSGVSYAEDIDSPKPIGTLTNEQGEVMEIEGILVNETVTPLTRASNTDMHERTYMYVVPRGVTGQVTADDADSASVTRAYITIYYTTTPDANGNDLYLLTKVSGYWKTPTDQAWVEKAYIDYACVRIGNESQLKTDVTVSNNFSINTGFTDGAPSWVGGTCGANLYLNLRRGTSSAWTLTVTNLLFGAL